MLICKRNQETNGLQIKQLIIFPLIIASDFGCFTRGRLHFYGIKRRITVAKPLVQQLTYPKYARVAVQGAFSCSSSVLRHKNNIAIERAIDFATIAIPSLRSLQHPNLANSCTISALGLSFLECFLVTHLTAAIKIILSTPSANNCVKAPCPTTHVPKVR